MKDFGGEIDEQQAETARPDLSAKQTEDPEDTAKASGH